MCTAYPCGEAQAQVGADDFTHAYSAEVGREMVSGLSSGVVTSLWPMGGAAESITGMDTAEFLSGGEIYHEAPYYFTKGATDLLIGSGQMFGGGTMFFSGGALLVTTDGLAVAASVPLMAGGVAVAGQGVTTAQAGWGSIGQGFDRVFNKGSEAERPAPLNVQETPVYRGGSSMQARPIDVKLTPTGTVKPTRGISLNTDPASLEKFGGVRQIKSIPDGLQVIQWGKPGHYELVPSREMPFEQYQQLLKQVEFH